MSFRELLSTSLASIIHLSESQVAALAAHYALLERWNQRINLTAIRNVEDAILRHYCESLFLAAHLPSAPMRIADLGSGAGFPGFPVSIARPDCQVTLIESHQRKAVFLRESTRNVSNVRVLACRADAVQEQFDFLTVRAVNWGEISSVVPSLAFSVALLVSEGDAADIATDRDFRWQPPVRLPWGNNRVLVIGSVSRGTSSAV